MHKKSHTPRRSHKKQLLIGATIVIILLGVASAGVYFYKDTLFPQQKSLDEQGLLDARNDATKLDAAGNTDAALVLIDESIEQTGTDADKAKLYIDKSLVLKNSKKDNEGAVNAAIRAAELAPSTASLAYVADLYAELGQNQKAIEYYKKTLDWSAEYYKDQINVETGEFPYNKSVYERQILFLGGSL
jgi:tetratricopeptide (TPR) repeat protein